jgi:Glucose / Sorbosone dehydrogenase
VKKLVTIAGGLIALVTGVCASASQERADAYRWRLVRSGFDAPLHVASTKAQPKRLYVVEQAGVIRVVVSGRLQPRPFLDIRSRVTSGGEQGLLSVAFHPNFAKNRLFYVDYTDVNGDTRVVQFKANRAGTAGVPSSARQLLFVQQPYPNHNGGQLAFGPDGLLYIGMGDGGSGGDPGNRAQNLSVRLGKLLKINATRRGAQTQVADYGLRNPWRFSFDRANGDLYIGDVGQGDWEEIDYVRGERAFLGQSAQPCREADHAGAGLQPLARLLGDRRLRLSRDGGAVGPRPLLLRRLLQWADVVAEDLRRASERRPPGVAAVPGALLFRRGPARRALRGHADRQAIPTRLRLSGGA